MFIDSPALHYVEVIITIKNISTASRILLMNFYQSSYAAVQPFLCKAIVIIILPEHTGVAFMRKDICISQHLIIVYGVCADDCLLYTSPSPRDGLLSRM